VLCDLGKPGEEERVHRAIDEIFAAALAVGGTLSGEHGIGITKRPYIAQALGEAGVKTMKAVKQALDPKGILNPGKIW
jgi:glycolate oxidase